MELNIIEVFDAQWIETDRANEVACLMYDNKKYIPVTLFFQRLLSTCTEVVYYNSTLTIYCKSVSFSELRILNNFEGTINSAWDDNGEVVVKICIKLN